MNSKHKLSNLVCFLSEHHFIYALIFIILGMFISTVLKFDLLWDFANYHYYNAWAFLNDRLNYDIVPSSFNTFFNPLLDLPLYFEIQYFNDCTTIIFALQGIWFGLFLFMLFKIGSLFIDVSKIQNISLLFFALIIAMTGQATYVQIGTSSNEIQVSFLILWGLYYLLKMIKYPKTQTKLLFWISGFIMGIALGFKPTCITYCIASGVMLMICFPYLKKPVLSILFFALGGLFGYLVVNGWWMWRLWNLFNNPFFPFANGFFHSPWFGDYNYRDERPLTEPTMMAIYPYIWYFTKSKIMEVHFFDIRLTLYYTLFWIFFIYMLLNRSFFKFYKEKSVKCAFFIFWGVSFIIWLILFSYLRYAVIIEALGTFFILKFFVILWKSRKLNKILFIFLSLILSVLLFLTPFVSDNYGSKQSVRKYIEVEKITLPANTLLKLYNFPTAITIPFFAQQSKIRALGYMHTACPYMRDDFVERGKFRKLRDDIELNHQGPVVIVYDDMRGDVKLKDERDNFEKLCKRANELGFKCDDKRKCDRSDLLEKALQKELSRGNYFCRELKNNIHRAWHICVPKELKTQILGEENRFFNY